MLSVQQLRHDTRASGAQSLAYGNLAAACDAARKQHIGNVHAGNQQHQPHNSHQDCERR